MPRLRATSAPIVPASRSRFAELGACELSIPAIFPNRRAAMQARYHSGSMAHDPLAQLRAWMDDAAATGIEEPTAAALATAGADGRSSLRFVLVRGIDEQGVRFYTNYESRKARALAANPFGALTFYWASLQRQVRLEGPVERLAPEQSDAYFASRPRGSRIGAWASRQSQELESRDELEARVAAMEARFPCA